MDINFYAYIMTATYALPALKKSKGSIIVMNSNMGKSSNGNIQPHTSLLKEYKASFHEYWLPYSLVTARKRSLGQGNISSSVCQGFCPRGVGGREGAWFRGGCLVLGGGCLVRGVPGPGGRGSPGPQPRGIWSRPTPKGEVEGDLVQAHT